MSSRRALSIVFAFITLCCILTTLVMADEPDRQIERNNNNNNNHNQQQNRNRPAPLIQLHERLERRRELESQRYSRDTTTATAQNNEANVDPEFVRFHENLDRRPDPSLGDRFLVWIETAASGDVELEAKRIAQRHHLVLVGKIPDEPNLFVLEPDRSSPAFHQATRSATSRDELQNQLELLHERIHANLRSEQSVSRIHRDSRRAYSLR